MTSRRNFLTLLGAGAAATLVGCGDGRTQTTADRLGTEIPDVLIVDTVDGLVVLHGAAAHSWGAAVATPDGQTIFAVRAVGADTELRTLSSSSGKLTGSVRVPGRWSPSTAGPLGDLVALVSPASGSQAAYPPSARDRTSVLIVRGDAAHQLDLPGNYVPDAFSRDGAGLFVLDWVPSTAPEHYRVREVAVATGAVSALLGRDKRPIPPEAEEQMRGVRRNAVFGAGGSVLYTLYTHQPGSGPGKTGWSGDDNAFVHTLHLEQRWAYCLDLPSPFGLDSNASHALAIDPSGSHLFVIDAAAGKLAVADTESLTVQRTVDVPKGAGPAYVTYAADALHLAVDTKMIVIGGGDLAPRPAWSLPARALGLTSSVDGQRIYVGLPDAVDWYDTTTGQHLGRVPVKGLTGLRQAI
jgi:hypothetical protein